MKYNLIHQVTFFNYSFVNNLFKRNFQNKIAVIQNLHL